MPSNDYFSNPLYVSHEWRKCRADYLKSVSYLCERCAKQGLIVPAEEVHHKHRIRPEDMTNPKLTLSFDNLEALCKECHEAEHTKYKKRWKVDEDGSVILPP